MITLADTAATEKLGKMIGAAATPSDNLVLTGDLGAGKTTLTKGIALGLGIDPVSYTHLTKFVFYCATGFIGLISIVILLIAIKMKGV
ncbi:hypothetical protein A5875_000463 [Enterococcus sp. 3H8_DIV0648]|nr:hypothetical protein A5875_000463 [Enterococcus sp. 3H8_DIV0648]